MAASGAERGDVGAACDMPSVVRQNVLPPFADWEIELC